MKILAVLVLTLLLVCNVLSRPQGDNACPTFCAANYDPVCGFNGSCHRQFSNDCALDGAKCTGPSSFTRVSLDECSKAGAKQC